MCGSPFLHSSKKTYIIATILHIESLYAYDGLTFTSFRINQGCVPHFCFRLCK